VDQMSEDGVLLTEEDRALLLKVSSLLEVIIETFDVLRDEETMRSVREAEEDLRAGRVRGYGEFIEELKKSGKI
jgi:PHD/YefM family antitoxin component YafN of YafNO toxin-antitoxin module